MLDSDPVEDLWQNGWDDEYISCIQSEELPDLPPFYLDLPPLSPSLIDSSALPLQFSNGLNESGLSLLLEGVDASVSNGTLGATGSYNSSTPLSLPSEQQWDGEARSNPCSSSTDLVRTDPEKLKYWWHDVALHSAVLLSFDDYFAGPGGLDDTSMLRHIIGAGDNSGLGGQPTERARRAKDGERERERGNRRGRERERERVTEEMPTKKNWTVIGDDEGVLTNENCRNLRSMLEECAKVVEEGDRQAGETILAQIQRRASPLGTSQERLAYYVAESLASRIAGINLRPNKNLWTSPNPDSPSLPCLLECFHQYNKYTPFIATTRFVATQAVLLAVEGARRIHILELASPDHQPWTALVSALASRPDPPFLRITSVVLSETLVFNTTLKAVAERVADKVSEYARVCGVPFEYCLWYGKLEGLRAGTMRRAPDEVLIVACRYNLHVLMDETVEQPSPRDRYLRFLKSLKPKLFIQLEVCGAYGGPFFLTRFREALSYFENYFEMLDSACPNEEHIQAASCFLGAVIQNAIAFEGTVRVQRPQTYRLWRMRVEAMGFQQVPIDVSIREKAKVMLRRKHKDFWVGDEDNWLVMGWKGRLAHACTTWKPRDSISMGVPSSHHKRRKV